MLLKFKITLLVIFLFSKNIIAQKTEPYFKDFFSNQAGRLKYIEGIYTVNLKLEKPDIYCSDCYYQNSEISDFDKIAIYFERGQFIVYSINKGIEIGYVEFNEKGSTIKFNSNGAMNYISSKDPQYSRCDKKGEITLNNRIMEITRAMDLFSWNIINSYKVQCNNTSAECRKIATFVNIEITIKKTYPNQFEAPKSKIQTGSGVIISKNGYIITNKHVVRESPKLSWDDFDKTWNNSKYSNDFVMNFSKNIKARIGRELYDLAPTNIDVGQDLVLLKIKNPPPNLKFAIIDTITPILGHQLYSLGYPLTVSLGSDVKYTQGYFSSTLNIPNKNIYPSKTEKIYQLNMGINPGNSGGGVFDGETGNLIGIATFRMNDDELGFKTEGISFATNLNRIIGYLKYSKSIFFILHENKSSEVDLNWVNDNLDSFKIGPKDVPILIRDSKYKPTISIVDNQQATVQIIAE
jgi:S1-C subfamily serine protease